MNNITEWIKYELYPILFENIDKAFPEHNFKRFSGGWKSKTYLNGTAHSSRQDKVVVSKKRPGYILEQGGDAVGLIDYVMERDSIEFFPAVENLSKQVGLSIPENPNFDQKSYVSYKNKITILETCNNYFIECLKNNKNADKERKYLISRGYSREYFKSMELGFIPNQEDLIKYLLKKGFTEKVIYEAIDINKDKRIGSTHTITIPYRSGGTIKGFKFRTVTGANPKYLNSAGLDRISGFFNLLGIKGNKDIVIVEGELDSLHATAKGIENIVAIGGSGISPDQVKDAIKRGAKSFTICFDREPGKEIETLKKSIAGIETILNEGVNRIYIAELPEIGNSKTDPDSFINSEGIEKFKEILSQALTYYDYKLQSIILKYAGIETKRDLHPREIEDMLDEVVDAASNITEPIHRDQFKKTFISLPEINQLGINEESLSITLDRIISVRDKKEQRNDFSKLLDEVNNLQKEGSTDKAIERLTGRIKEIKLKDRATEFSSLLISTKEDEMRSRLVNKPDSLNSGYTIAGEELLLPSGAISIFAAPTSHGKTTLLINTALNVAKTYDDKEILFFSYEEDRDSIVINALNTFLEFDISLNNRKTLKSYFTTGSTQFIKTDVRDYFKAKKDLFFSELIEDRRLNINYSSYDSDTLIEAIRYLHKNTSIGAVFIDYIQLLNLPKGKYKTYSRQEEIKEICIALKDLAVETGLPIILGSQFNREVVNQLRLHATKLGEAGDIERIANLIVGFWNNNFKPLGTPAELSEISQMGCDNRNTLYAKVLKNRGGVVEVDEILNFKGNTGKINNSDFSEQENPFK